MRILIDIGHPAHIHLFKHFAWEMQKRNHELMFTVRDKEHEIYLLKKYYFNYTSFGKHYKSKIGKAFGLLKFNLLLIRISIKFKPEIFLSHGSMYAAQAAWLSGKPHIALEDTGNMEQIRFYRPFTQVMLVPDILPDSFGKKEIRYGSFHEIAYLHDKYFKPDPGVLKYLKIDENTAFAILRFVSWDATHDKGNLGFNLEDKKKLISILRKKMKVYISSERELPSEFEKYRIDSPPELIHSALFYAKIHIGEGATMASEAGLMGTTTVYVNSIRASNCEDQNRFGLVHNFRKSSDALQKIEEIINNPEQLMKNNVGRKSILAEKIDLTSLLVWFIENYPASTRTLKNNPDYQYNFK